MIELLRDNWPWAAKVSFVAGAIRLGFLWITAYPLLLLERQKNKALLELIEQLEAIIDRLVALIEQKH